MVTRRTLSRRLRRGLLITLGSAVVLVLILGIALSLRPVRERALSRAIDQASTSLPGELRVGESRWTSVERIEIEDLLWTQDGDTLLGFDYLRVEVDVGALLRRDVHLRRLHIEGLRLASGPLSESFADGEEQSDKDAQSSSTASPFPRGGSIPSVPSIAVDRLDIAAQRIVLPDASVLCGKIELSLDLLAKHAPRAAGTVEARLNERPAARLAIDSPGPEVWTLALTDAQSDTLLTLAVRGDSEDPAHVDRGRFALGLKMPSLEDASAFPGLDSLLLAAPELVGASLAVEGRFDGSADLAPEDPWLSLDLLLESWSLLQRASGHLDWGRSGSELRLDLEQLAGASGVLQAHGQHPLYELQLDLEVLSGLRLQPYLAEDALPADLAARLALQMDIDLQPVSMAGVATLHAAIPSRELDTIDLELDLRGGLEEAAGRLAIFARSGELSLASRLDWQRAARLSAQLSPLLVRVDSTAQGVPQVLSVLADSRLTLDERTRELDLEGLVIEGDAGRAQLDLLWSEQRARNLDLAWEWNSPPAILRLLGPNSASRDSLIETLWRDDSGYRMQLSAHESAPSSERFEAQFSARLPAPGLLLPSLPVSLGAEAQALEIQGFASGTLDSARVTLNAVPNNWLEALNLSVRRASDATVLDSLVLALPGLALRARGDYDGEQLVADADLSFHNDALLQELLGDAIAEPSARISAQLTVLGRPEALDAELFAGGEFHSSLGSIDTLVLHAQVVEQDLQSAELHAQQLSYHEFLLDDLDLQWRAEGAALLPGVAALQLRGPELSLLQILRVERDSVWTAEMDTLDLQLAGVDLRSRHPFRILVRPERKAVWIDDLDLAGSLGQVSGDLRFGPRVKQGSIEMHLSLPKAPASWSVPDGAWPETVDLKLSVDDAALTGELESNGMGLGSRRDLALRVHASSEADSSYVDLSLRHGEDVLVQGTLLLPYGYVADGPRWEARPGRPTVDLRVKRLPLPARLGDQRGMEDYFVGRGQDYAPFLDAHLRIDRNANEPRGALEAFVDFPDIPELAGNKLLLGAVWGAPQDTLPPLNLDPELDRLMHDAHSELVARGVALRMEWKAESGPTVEFGAFSPLAWDSRLGGLDWDRSGARAELRTSQLQLEDFNRFMPDRMRVQGLLQGQLAARGDPAEMTLEGNLEGKELGFADPGRAEAVADLDFTLSGTTQAPVVRGRIEIRQGTLRIPERSKSYLDIEGTSILWEAASAEAQRKPERGRLFGPDETSASLDSMLAPTLLPKGSDVSIELSIPKSVWIRGRGLDVRLTGALRMTQAQGAPVVVGKLSTVEGRFSFMSKTFRAQRGTVEFFGDPNNPSLDIEVNARVSDADITILIRGTAQKPELELRSDPHMDEAEIMSYLLFGGPTASLDQAGSDLLAQQAINALDGFAIPALEGGVASDLGISMIQLKQNDTSGQGMNIMVGRYITPELLLKYEMSLENSQDYTVNLEYWMTRRLSLQSYYSQAKESGVELNWSKDY